MEIIKLQDNGEFIAGYDPLLDRICYNERLDRYPQLKKNILDHELKHSQHKYNLLFHMYLDTKDLVYLFRKDWYDYYMESDRPKPTVKHSVVMGLYSTFNMLRAVVQVPLIILSVLFHSTLSFINKRR